MYGKGIGAGALGGVPLVSGLGIMWSIVTAAVLIFVALTVLKLVPARGRR
jgi:predicted MFS family arabinose efflux permease